MRVLVCVTRQKTCERLIRAGALLANQRGASLSVLHLVKPGEDFLENPSQSEALEYLFQVTAAQHADMSILRAVNPMDSMINFVHEQEIDMIVVGGPGVDKRWYADGDFAHELSLRLPEVAIQVVTATGDGQ